MSRPDDIIGYTYMADEYLHDRSDSTAPDHYRTSDGLGEGLYYRLRRAGILAPAALDMTTEEALDWAAEAMALDRYDESSFDSDDFPKVILRDQRED